MKQMGWIISKYLVQAILPYFVFSWLLLSVILFVQQASRYADIFFSVNVPANLISQLTISLIPNVIAFTCPMAMLVGTIIGLAKMQGDSELVAIRAAGVGNLQIAVPIMIIGLFFSIFAFFVNSKGVPLAAALVRSVALQTAIKKLESPIEPGVFNTEIAGYTIYAKDGDIETGRWRNLFVYREDVPNGRVHLITSQNGRIDISGQLSELTLEDATVSTLPLAPGHGNYVTENIGEIRLAIKTRRSELIEKLNNTGINPDELGLQQLSDYADSKDGKERVEARILWQRRILLSITPLIFCILGTVIILRLNRGGRGFGIFLALGVLIGFYMLAFLGEQLARVGMISVFVSSFIPIVSSFLAIVWLSSSRRFDLGSDVVSYLQNVVVRLRAAPSSIQSRNIFVDLTTGLRDFDIFRNLLKYSLLTLCFLIVIFVVFTAFELWKFAGAFDGGVLLLTKYLIYLLPFVYLQIAPSAGMIGTLATYVIKSRQNEIVVWASTGQSVYRLLWPCFVLMVLLGGVNWVVQERVLPFSNRLQDETRYLITHRGIPEVKGGRYWVANDNRIFSFTIASDNEKPGSDVLKGTGPPTSASDNEKNEALCTNCRKDITVYEFTANGQRLQTVYRANSAVWERGSIRFIGNTEKVTLVGGKSESEVLNGGELAEATDPFIDLRTKPSHLDTSGLKRQIAVSDAELDRRNLKVALEKKYSVPFLPLVMALFCAPFALSLSRNRKSVMIGYAIGLWLLFTGTSTVFEQLGLNGFLAPALAVWSPLVLFSLLGIFLLSKVRT